MGRIAIVLAMVAACSQGELTTGAETPTVISSPGPLIMGHRELDDLGACDRCHVDGDPKRGISADKCLSCHNLLAVRLKQSKGFHASPIVRDKPCEICHADHRGRSFDPMGWRSLEGGRDGFDHDNTGWRLDGAHRMAACRSCHTLMDTQGLETFIGTSRQCGNCHARASPHNFEKRDLQACGRCHSLANWQPLSESRFDHDDRKDARMPLLGVHENIPCRACHAGAVFNLGMPRPDRCESCHASPHGGHLFGRIECSWCHSPTFKSFAGTSFDHAEKTRFDLGGHKQLECSRCHTTSLGMAKPPSACESCHADRNPHGARFAQYGSPAACAKCHTTMFGAMPTPKWRLSGFDHGKNTKFPLNWKHAELACRACHRGVGPTDFEKLDASKGCMGCHAHADVHDKKFSNAQCIKCHVAPGSSY